ncbi:hypothetical protein LWI29_008800 [Acer saccharum]|uniref:Uncharacterized protein n=1 Tax=Acer saccharum TaxID=4024 RepID=A0AA39RCL6_ACESA|nr:hypothetical protein LWI29_008800 [Acer saccharum]
MSALELMKGRSGSSETVRSRKVREVDLESSSPVKHSETGRIEGICVDGPTNGPLAVVMTEAQELIKVADEEQMGALQSIVYGPIPSKKEDPPINPDVQPEVAAQFQNSGTETNKAPMVKGKKWKRIARDIQRQTSTVPPLGNSVQKGSSSLPEQQVSWVKVLRLGGL